MCLRSRVPGSYFLSFHSTPRATPHQVSIAKKNHFAEVRGEWVARDQTDSTNLCSDYVEHFLRDSPAPGIGWEAGVLAPLLETVGTEDVNQVAER